MKRIARRGLPLNALRAFASVARHGSFSGAAHALLISPSTLSQHVTALERLIGVRLFERGPLGVALTRAGEHIRAAVSKSLDCLEHAIDELRGECPPGERIVRVQMPLSFALHLSVPVLREFRRRSGGLGIDLAIPSAGAPLGGFDLAVRYSAAPGARFVADILWPIRLRILCHPRLAAQHRGRGLAEFIQANDIVHVRHEGPAEQEPWARFLQRNGLIDLALKRRLVVDSPALATRYVLGGEGITLADAQLFGGQIRRGELVSPFAAELDTGCACYLVRHPEGLADPATTLLRTCLLEHLPLLPPAASSAEGPRAHVPPFARGRLAHSFELLPRSRDLR